MGNQLTKPGGNYLANTEDFYAALAAEANNLKGGGDGKAFMKFDGNDGDFSYGAEDEPLPKGTRMAANLTSYKRGWVIWVDGKVVHEEMVALTQGPQPEKRDLPDKGPYGEEDGPVEQYTIDFRLIDEPYIEMVFQANNVSKRRALAAFLKDFGNTFRNHPGEVPIIALDSNEFEGKTKGGRKVTKYAPKFKIVDWMKEEDLAALVEGTPDDYDAKAPALEDKRPARRDEEDERPARRSAGKRTDEDERPARRSAREEEDERPARRPRDEEEDERPARRPARDEDERDERPARRAREEEDERPARRPRDEEEDDRPARRPARDEDERDERPARRARDEEDETPAERPARSRGRF